MAPWMEAKDFNYLLFTILLLQYSNANSIYDKIQENDDKNFNVTSHLENAKIKFICENRDNYCKYNGPNVCTLRKLNNVTDYKDFENACHLFLSNMCDYPGREFYILLSSETCEDYLTQRRNIEVNEKKVIKAGKPIQDEISKNKTVKTETGILRNNLYVVNETFDNHPCPKTCPDIYAPVCLSINKGYGKIYKMYSFMNQCLAYVYYCKHYNELEIPPDFDEPMLTVQGLSFTYCGSTRYSNFYRISQAASSLGHYGWLAGSERYTHILEPHQRRPGMG